MSSIIIESSPISSNGFCLSNSGQSIIFTIVSGITSSTVYCEWFLNGNSVYFGTSYILLTPNTNDEVYARVVTCSGETLRIGNWIEDNMFYYNDVPAGVHTYYVDLKASFDYKILSSVFKSNNNGLVQMQIDGVPIVWTGSGTSINISNTITDTEAISSNYVSIGQKVTLITNGSNVIRGKIRFIRVMKNNKPLLPTTTTTTTSTSLPTSYTFNCLYTQITYPVCVGTASTIYSNVSVPDVGDTFYSNLNLTSTWSVGSLVYIDSLSTSYAVDTSNGKIISKGYYKCCVQISDPLKWSYLSAVDACSQFLTGTYYGNNSSFALTTTISASSACLATLGGWYSNGVIWKYTSDGTNFTLSGTCSSVTTTTTTVAPQYYGYKVNIYVCGSCTLIQSNIIVQDTNEFLLNNRYYFDNNSGYVYKIIGINQLPSGPISDMVLQSINCSSIPC